MRNSFLEKFLNEKLTNEEFNKEDKAKVESINFLDLYLATSDFSSINIPSGNSKKKIFHFQLGL